jgi:hypothetical protein
MGSSMPPLFPAGEDKKSILIIRILALAFLAGIFLSWPLWLNDRNFPLAPVLPFIQPPHVLSRLLMYAFLTALSLLFLFPERRIFPISVFLLGSVMILADQNRCQPWAYQYLLMLFLFCFYRRGKTDLLHGMRLMICGIYFWSGIQKLNPLFFSDMAPWITEPLSEYFSPAFAALACKAAWIFPAIEIFIPFGLMFFRTSRTALFLAIAMHVYIIFLASPLGKNANHVILPWNIAMIAFLWLLFKDRSSSLREIFSSAKRNFILPVFVLVWLLPLLSSFGMWDDYLSASLYSGNSAKAYIYISKNVKGKLTLPLREKVYTQVASSGPDTLYYLFVNQWAEQELRTPVYPEQRVFEKVKEEIVSYADDPSEVSLVIQHKSTWTTKPFYETVK